MPLEGPQRPTAAEARERPMPAPSALRRLQTRLAEETRAEVRFDRGTRGLYATDASLYQIDPLGVIVPRTAADVARRVLAWANGADPDVLRPTPGPRAGLKTTNLPNQKKKKFL